MRELIGCFVSFGEMFFILKGMGRKGKWMKRLWFGKCGKGL